jgi:NAD(P)-dependent dehydrogenase (short-subunit alcohol dehydrogenase family)
MIQKGARHIVLISRSGKATGKVADLIEDAKALGAQIIVRPCDVSSKEQVERLVNEDLSGMPAVGGVIHAAMVLHVCVLPIASIYFLTGRLAGRSLREDDLRAMGCGRPSQSSRRMELSPCALWRSS